MKFDIKKLFVGLTAACGVYWGFMALDVYETDSKVAIKSLNESPSVDLSTLITNPGIRREESTAKEYLLSKSFALQAEKDLKLISSLKGNYTDFRWYLSSEPTSEEFYKMWSNIVKVELKEPSGFLAIKVRSLTPEDSLKLHNYLLKNAELFLNESSKKVVQEQFSFMKQRRLEIEKELEEARKSVTEFQKNKNMLDLDLESKEIASLIANLESEHAKLKVELDSLRSTHVETSEEYKILKGKVTALSTQIASQRKKLSKSRNWENSIEWASLQRKLEFLEAEWKSALAQEEKLSTDFARKLKTMVVVENPVLPQEAVYPNRIQEFLTSLFISAIMCLLMWILKGIIEEQKRRA